MISPSSVKDIATASGIKPGCLYKWRTTSVNLSVKKMDALLKYFIESEPLILVMAEIEITVLLLLYSNSCFLSEEEVVKGG